MKRNGFTLIELVVVIVILGILAVVAAPKFLNLQQDARDASLKGLEGAIKSTLGVTYAKLATLGLESAAYLVDDENVLTSDTKKIAVVADLSTLGCKKDGRCVFEYGYPSNYAPTLATLVDGISANEHAPSDDFVAVRKGKTSYDLAITFKNNVERLSSNQVVLKPGASCYIDYSRPSKDKPRPVLTIVPCK
ncbi:TPA: type II secretion system protein [Photobacterium damselae]